MIVITKRNETKTWNVDRLENIDKVDEKAEQKSRVVRQKNEIAQERVARLDPARGNNLRGSINRETPNS